MARFRPAAALLAVACALSPACRRGGHASARTAEELLPAQPPGAATTAALAQLAQHAGELLSRVSSLPGGEQAGETRKAVTAQLGFDPFSREGLVAAGLDPDRGAAFSLAQGPGAPGFVAALPLASERTFTQTFERLARERGGYDGREEIAVAGAKGVVFSKAGGQRKLGYAVVRGYAIVARTDDPAADLQASQARTSEQSLAQDPRFAAMRAELGAADLIVYAPAQGALQARLLRAALPGDLGVGLSGGGLGLRARAVLSLPAPDAHELSDLLPGGGEALSTLLPKDSPVQLRVGLAPAQLPAQLARVPRLREPLAALRGALAEKKVDLDKDLFGALQPGVVAALSLSPRADLSRAIDGGAIDLRRGPFDLLQLAAFARPSDEARLGTALAAVSAVLPRFGASATRLGGPEAREWQVTYPGGEGARFGIRAVGGAPLAYLAGGTTLDDLQARQGGRGAAGKDAVAAQVDLGLLAAQVAALPSSAYGKGPQSYVARSIVSQVIEPLRPLVVRGTLGVGPRGLTAEVFLDIGKPDAPP